MPIRWDFLRPAQTEKCSFFSQSFQNNFQKAAGKQVTAWPRLQVAAPAFVNFYRSYQPAHAS